MPPRKLLAQIANEKRRGRFTPCFDLRQRLYDVHDKAGIWSAQSSVSSL
jgi:hypothetical protein